LIKNFNIQGYPTLFLFRDGKPSEFRGGRTKNAIIQYLEKQLHPALTELKNSAEAYDFSTSDKVVVIAHLSKDDDSFKVFQEVSNVLRDDYRFGFVSDEKSVEILSLGAAPSLTVFKKFDDGRTDYTGEFSASEITSFVRVNAVPLVDEVGPENYRFYVDTGLPLVFVFVNPSDTDVKEETLRTIKPIAAEFRGVLNFVWIDSVRYAGHGQNLGLSGKVTPAIVIHVLKDNTRYIYPEDSEFTSSSIFNWFDSYTSGDLIPHLKSEPIPTENDGPVTVIVGKTFEEIVLESDKDVMMEFYAPWCGHCKSLAPIYDQVGEFYKGSNVIIAKMDATLNDAKGVEIQGFPTIKFYKAGQKSAPLDFDGDRTLEGFKAYISKHASAPSTKSSSHDEL